MMVFKLLPQQQQPLLLLLQEGWGETLLLCTYQLGRLVRMYR